MNTKTKPIFNIGEAVFFDIGNGLCFGRGIVAKIEREEEDDCFVYQLFPYETLSGGINMHLKDGELWVNEFELELQD